MSEQSITLRPGVSTINVAMQAGTTIYNTDNTNSVWVSTNPSVLPGIGMRIGPKGSLNWTSDGQPCYGTVDTGVTSTVQLTVSTHIRDLVNPIDVGIAVATQLLAQGVPSVFLGDLLYSDTVPNVGVFTVPGDITKYASLNINVQSSGAVLKWGFRFKRAGQYFDTIEYVDSGGGFGVTTDVAVRGTSLDILWLGTSGTVRINVFGSNRMPKDSVNAPAIPRSIRLNQAFTINVPVTTNGTFPDTMPNYRSNGMPTYMRMVVTGAGAGKLGVTSVDQSGLPVTLDLADSKIGTAGSDGTELEQFITIPPGQVNFVFTPSVTGTYVVQITLVPQPI